MGVVESIAYRAAELKLPLLAHVRLHRLLEGLRDRRR